jgi:acyl carrier protein
MEATEVRQQVLNIIADISMEDSFDTLKDEVSLREQLDLDSMDFLDIVMELKKRHKIDVPQEDYSKLATLESCVQYLTPKFKQ